MSEIHNPYYLQPFPTFGGAIYTHFVLDSTGYGAPPDLNFRNFAGGSIRSNLFSSASWITNAGFGQFQFPDTGLYICTIGKRINNAEGGTFGLFLRDTLGNIYAEGATRVAINAGTDPSANIVRSGASGGAFLFRPIAGRTYAFGGYWNGSALFSVAFTAAKIGN